MHKKNRKSFVRSVCFRIFADKIFKIMKKPKDMAAIRNNYYSIEILCRKTTPYGFYQSRRRRSAIIEDLITRNPVEISIKRMFGAIGGMRTSRMCLPSM